MQGQELRNHRYLAGPEAGALEEGGERPEDDLAAGVRLPGLVWSGSTQHTYCPACHRTDQSRREKSEALNLRGEELITTIKTLSKNNKKK